MRILALTTILAAGSLSAASFDPGIQIENFRCDGRVLHVGDHNYQILEACGDPDFRETIEIRRESVEVRGPDNEQRFELEIGDLQTVERWVYRDDGRLTRVLTVSGGVVTDIRLRDR